MDFVDYLPNFKNYFPAAIFKSLPAAAGFHRAAAGV